MMIVTSEHGQDKLLSAWRQVGITGANRELLILSRLQATPWLATARRLRRAVVNLLGGGEH